MPSSRYTSNISGGGVTINAGKTRESDAAEGFEVTLPAGKTVTSWVKTDADTADATLPGGHGYTTGVFDVFWDGGSRYGVTGTIVSNAITLDGGQGDDFPASATVGVVVTSQVQVTISLDGDNLVLFGIKPEFADQSSEDKAQITFFDTDGSVEDEIAHLDLNANQLTVIDVEGGDTNPFAGSPISYAKASNGSASAACTLKMVRAQDSTP